MWCLSGLDDPAVCLEHPLGAEEVVERLLGFLLEGDVHTGISYFFKLAERCVFNSTLVSLVSFLSPSSFGQGKRCPNFLWKLWARGGADTRN